MKEFTEFVFLLVVTISKLVRTDVEHGFIDFVGD